MKKIIDLVEGIETLRGIIHRLNKQIRTMEAEGRDADTLHQRHWDLSNKRILLMVALYCYECGDVDRAYFTLAQWPKWQRSVNRWRTHPPH